MKEKMKIKNITRINENCMLNQIAFGLDSHATSNPDTFKIMEYTREHGVIPNTTVAEISDETANKLVSICGAVSISRYYDKNICYDSIKKLTDRGLLQTNMHFMICAENFEQAKETLNDILIDERLKKMHAIIFLSLKKKGRGTKFTPLSFDKFKQLIDFAFENNIKIGFDSCTCLKFLEAIKNNPKFEEYKICCESCESGKFSLYFNVDGLVFPCSFCENEKESYLPENINNSSYNWENGIDLTTCTDFIKEVWNNPKMVNWRNSLINNKDVSLNCIKCPMFEI